MALLERGQKIGLVATADPIAPFLHQSLEYSTNFFRRLGLEPVFGKNTLLQPTTGQKLVNSKLRAEDVNTFAKDPEIKAIVNLWGGYDSADLLPHLDWEHLKDKMLIGASDFTTILTAAHVNSGVLTYLWANAIWLGLDIYRRSEESFERFFMQDEQKKTKSLFMLEKPKVLKSGDGIGTLIGGNLDTFIKLVGTPYFPKSEQMVFVMEDLFVSQEKFKSQIEKLLSLGFFDACQGIIIGNFSGKKNEESEAFNKQIQKLCIDLFSKFNFPILTTSKLGHNVANEVFPVGATVTLDTNNEAYLFKE